MEWVYMAKEEETTLTKEQSIDDLPLDEFELSNLIVEGNEVIERLISYFNIKTKEERRMKVYLKPVPHTEWNKATSSVNKKSNKNIEELIVSQSLCYEDGIFVPISDIRNMQKGVISSIYEEVKIISGQFEDRMEEKFLEKLSDF